MNTIGREKLQSTNNVNRALKAGKLMSQREARSLFQAERLFFCQAQRGDAVRGKGSWTNRDWTLWTKLELCHCLQRTKTFTRRILSISPYAYTPNSFVHVNGPCDFTVLLPLCVDTTWEWKQLGQAHDRCKLFWITCTKETNLVPISAVRKVVD